MKKLRTLKIYALVSIFVIALIITAFNLVQAQVKVTKGPPPDKGKQPKLTCDNDGICEYDEYDSTKSPENQPCQDCLPKTYPPLVINQINKQIVCTGSSFYYSSGKVFQYKYVDSEYMDTWASDSVGVSGRVTSIGDVDTDGLKEITTVVNYLIREESSGKGKNKVVTRYYDQKIFIFETGDSGIPCWESQYLGESTSMVRDTIIADVDNDHENELVILKGKNIEIFKIEEWGDSYSFTPEHVGIFPEYDHIIFTIDVGDADNDGEKELVLAMFEIGAPIIWKYKDGTWEEIIAEQISIYNKKIGFLGIDYARVRDADDLPGNEIIAGGNNNRLMVWKYDEGNGIYKSVFISDDLGAFTQGVDAGDINGDGQNEVVIGGEAINIFKYSGGTYYLVNSASLEGGLIDLVVGDLDNDGKDEIALSAAGLRIFDYIGVDLNSGYLEQIYHSPYIVYLEID